ncbi:MAG: alpha-hydroxy-acid oxidizing protein [Microbacteriaceae bacterium]|nr:alpha-hydroxy-acid oxidizing protein [Microbacteriaceae bacterium]
MVQRKFPNPVDVFDLMRFKKPVWSAKRRRLAAALTIHDLRTIAKRRTPKAAFDYIDGAADGEISLARARQAWEDVEFHPDILNDVSKVDTSTTVLGGTSAYPFGLAPIGFSRIGQTEGELGGAKAAAAFGIPFSLSTLGNTAIETVAATNPGRNWYQLYVMKQREISYGLVERAAAAGFDTLMFTVDAPIGGNRLRDTRNGFSIPPQLTLGTLMNALPRPWWWWDFLTTPKLEFASLKSTGGTVGELLSSAMDPTISFADLDTIRGMWPGRLVVKGVQNVADSKRLADLGVDGIRLDAIPYLYESEEGDGEGEPPTHAFLREMRAVVDAEFPGRMLLAEANAWPEEVATYFGTDDAPEAHMAFDFPVMPRVFYALRSQHAGELVKVLQTAHAEVPDGAAWGAFLRNHDELSLEMVSEEYRHAMYGWYAYDPRMRANVGIRRRLAPLLDNDREEIELAHALLLSLAGAPFLYYGDEIGMGDNIWLPDRDASRTPMQWNPDRNAGFSSADPGKLVLPVVQSLVYHYQHVNVEAQLAQSRSLLRWLRGALHVRRAHPVLALGSLAVAASDHESVLAFVREYGGSEGDIAGDRAEHVLCVFSFAHTAVSARVALPAYAGASVTDLFGGGRFPAVREDGVLEVTLGPRGFYWLKLEQAVPRAE